MINLITRSNKIYHIGRSLKFCGTMHYLSIYIKHTIGLFKWCLSLFAGGISTRRRWWVVSRAPWCRRPSLTARTSSRTSRTWSQGAPVNSSKAGHKILHVCRQATKIIYPGRGLNTRPPVCKSGALPTELPGWQFFLRLVPIHHSELTVLHVF